MPHGPPALPLGEGLGVGFEESALLRFRRYREEATLSLGLMREAEEAARSFWRRRFGGLEHVAKFGREAGFVVEAAHEREVFVVRSTAGPGAEAGVVFGLLEGAAAETDEDLMHEELSRYTLDPSGYSGRILGFSEAAGEEPCQIFAVYQDGAGPGDRTPLKTSLRGKGFRPRRAGSARRRTPSRRGPRSSRDRRWGWVAARADCGGSALRGLSLSRRRSNLSGCCGGPGG